MYRLLIHIIFTLYYTQKFNKDNDFNKYLPEILNIFKDLTSHWTTLNR